MRNRSLRWLFLALLLVQLACRPTSMVLAMEEEHEEHAATEHVEQAAEAVHEAVEDVVVEEEAHSIVEEVVEDVQEVYEDVQETVAAVVEKSSNKASELVSATKDKIGCVVDKVVTKSKALVDRVKGMSKQDAKKVAAAVVGVWGVSVGVGWLAQAVKSEPSVTNKKGKK